jgi:transcriptional regulator with XRE-family HTH domain
MSRPRYPAAAVGRQRAAVVAARLGVALRDARRSALLSQHAVAERCGISQQRISELERGRGERATLGTWSKVAAGVGEQLVAFIENQPGANLPRDIEHARRQALVIETARGGGWVATPEARVLTYPDRPRSIDVLLRRREREEAAVIEVWNLILDVGAAIRGLDDKIAAVGSDSGAERVAALWVVRSTSRNRSVLAQLAPMIGPRFPADPRAWLRALRDPDAPMPVDPGILWTDNSGTRLFAGRSVAAR